MHGRFLAELGVTSEAEVHGRGLGPVDVLSFCRSTAYHGISMREVRQLTLQVTCTHTLYQMNRRFPRLSARSPPLSCPSGSCPEL